MSSPFVAYLVNNAEPNEQFAEEIEQLLDHPPTDEDDDNIQNLTHYIGGLIKLIIVWVMSFITPIQSRLDSLERTVSESVPSKSQFAYSTAQKSAPRKPGQLTKCSKCHARGHSDQECKSTNPSAVRRRIAQNAKIRAERRKITPLQSLQSVHMPYAAPPHPFAGIPPEQSAFMVEAAELRRRIAQSNRDKRRASRTMSKSSS
jgi:hypothetical protein